MVKLKKPVLCEVDENYFVSAADFRSYAHCMMYPDLVGIVMSGKLNDIVTGAVNDGKSSKTKHPAPSGVIRATVAC